MKVLDCTLRDGGYYNNWEFPKHLVQKYLFSCHQAGIDYVEVGLRSPKKNRFLGAHAYTTEGYLAELNPPKDLNLGVMVNTADFKQEGVLLTDYFLPAEQSLCSLVRIASHFTEIKESLFIAKSLKSMGYTVGLNLMQIGIQADQTIEESLKLINNSDSIDVLYFADSLGNMGTADINRCIELIKGHWNKSIGIHAHNNMSQALPNTLESLRNGVTWLDSTVLGMGRGAGNTQTELLLTELLELGHTQYQPSHFYSLTLEEFEPLKNEYNWGPSLLYYLAAKHKIHPSFIQDLMNNSIYDHLDQINAINTLSQIDSTKYKSVDTSKILHNKDDLKMDAFTLDVPNEQPILIVANGPSAHKYKNEIETFIQIKKPFVISLNFVNAIDEKYVDMYALCNPARILSNLNNILNIDKTILMPVEQLDEGLKALLKKSKTVNYNLTIDDELSFDLNGCTMDSPLVLGFTLCALLSNKRSKVFMTGFDGYKGNSERNRDINNLIEDLSSKNKEMELISITPTRYNMNQQSIYSNGVIYTI